MAKSTKQPPVQGTGRYLWPYRQIQDLNLSLLQLYDQMVRHYHRHTTDSDVEGDRYKQKLLEDINKKNSLALNSQRPLLNPIQISLEEDSFDITNNSQESQEELLSLIEEFSINIKKNSRLGNETTESLKSLIITHLVEIETTIECISIQKELAEIQDVLSSVASVVSSVDEELKGTVPSSSLPKRDIVRSSARLKNNKPRKLKEQLQEEKSLKQEIEKLEIEAIGSKQQLQNLQKDLDLCRKQLQQKDDDLSTLTMNISSLTEENSRLHLELQQLQESFEDINKDLVALRNIHSSTATPIQTLGNSHVHTISASISVSNGLEADEEGPNNPHSSHPLDAKKIKEIFKTLSNIEKLEKINDTDAEKYRHGLKLLKDEFLHHGRKVWSTKTVESLLKCLSKECTLSLPSIRLDFNSSSSKLLHLLKQLSGLKIALVKFQIDSMKELDILRTSKAKYSNLQSIIITNSQDFQKSIDDLQEQTLNLLDGIQNDSLTKEKRLEDLITKTVENSLANLHLGSDSDNVSNSHKNIPLTKATNQTKKVVLIPNKDVRVDDISRSLREKARELADFPELSSLRRTKNNNVEIKSIPPNLEKLTAIIESSDLKNKVQVIDPEARQMKILLLRIPSDITADELLSELSSRSYFANNFEVLKPIEVKNKDQKNWLIQGTALDCRRLLKSKRLKIFTESFRVVHFIRIIRCTNCQALDHHVKSHCKWAAECGNCGRNHHSSECKAENDNKLACINCIRSKKKTVDHRAWDPKCSTYQQIKQDKLYNYYNPSSQIFTSGETQVKEQYNHSSSAQVSNTKFRPRTKDLTQDHLVDEVRIVRFNTNKSQEGDRDALENSARGKVFFNSNIRRRKSNQEAMPPRYR